MATIRYTFAHWLRDHFPFHWKLIERINGRLFRLRYTRRLKCIVPEAYRMALPYEMISIADIPTEELVAFFHRQPKELYRWFTPHGFEAKDVEQLQRNASFLAYVLKQNNQIVGYFFLRCYFNEECYFGRLVDFQHTSSGIGTLINKVSFFISESLHMQSFQTIAKGNIASIKSCAKAYRLQPVRTIANGDILYKNVKL
jgi:hypothetical protein